MKKKKKEIKKKKKSDTSQQFSDFTWIKEETEIHNKKHQI